MGKIQNALVLVRDKLNEYFRNTRRGTEDWVILSNVLDHENRFYDATRDKLVMFLANITHETTISTYRRNVPVSGDSYAIVAPPLYIDLYVLFLANFYDKSYIEGLGVISETIGFFQQNPFFTHDNLPSLDDDIDKLTFEIVSLDITDLNYLMGLVGAKYLPSVFYKVRMIPFQSGAMQAEVPAAKGLQTPYREDDEALKEIGGAGPDALLDESAETKSSDSQEEG